MLKNAYVLAKLGDDTAENKLILPKFWQISWRDTAFTPLTSQGHRAGSRLAAFGWPLRGDCESSCRRSACISASSSSECKRRTCAARPVKVVYLNGPYQIITPNVQLQKRVKSQVIFSQSIFPAPDGMRLLHSSELLIDAQLHLVITRWPTEVLFLPTEAPKNFAKPAARRKFCTKGIGIQLWTMI